MAGASTTWNMAFGVLDPASPRPCGPQTTTIVQHNLTTSWQSFFVCGGKRSREPRGLSALAVRSNHRKQRRPAWARDDHPQPLTDRERYRNNKAGGVFVDSSGPKGDLWNVVEKPNGK
eukprot:CAMPEP_0194029160 /NCGR_PEP_ID=MMETSP0009_2-20130614/2977_1 /TAXON_ID=210454 /ORGANISM="Grammatophora oceanica, Strain CCMP 410" /LENGTH=117 /DNA_ID=CAMNT_0038668759 /DNA_START=205 /DNA_END=558 /DNA_ORIENTATION=-